MSIFNLPDLGEGLPDAEIHEWHVKEGETVKVDQLLVSMETAKAVVEVPSPQEGVIKKLYGKPGDIIKTGTPLVEFVSTTNVIDSGTVVGHLESQGITVEESFLIGTQQQQTNNAPKATPAVRALANKLNVDLRQVRASNPNGIISLSDVEQAATLAPSSSNSTTALPSGYEPLHGVRRSMALNMSKAHAEVVPVSIYDDADIQHWSKDTDITVNLLQAIIAACQQEPALNAWYHGEYNARKLLTKINIGLAMDIGNELFVPVVQDVANQSRETLRQTINQLKQNVRDRSLPPEAFQGCSITLSNFGNFAGRYASPIVVPPTVAILGVGRLREEVVARAGEIVIHRILPLSLTFDHRAVTGGEATRFLGAIIQFLEASP